MKKFALLICAALTLALTAHAAEDGWVSLFNGKNLDGWKVAVENPGSFKVEDGILVIDSGRSHLFYAGPVANANFKNFEFKAQVKTYPKANSGLYLHTQYQDKGWPGKGYEAQVNNTHSDRKKTGGLYGIQDVMDNPPAKDKEWFDYYIKVDGKRIIIKINGEVTADYTEPADLDRPGRQLSSGTFAIQAHDPKSRTEYKNIQVKVLP